MTRDDDYWIRRYTPPGENHFDGFFVELGRKTQRKTSQARSYKGPSVFEGSSDSVKRVLFLTGIATIGAAVVILVLMV